MQNLALLSQGEDRPSNIQTNMYIMLTFPGVKIHVLHVGYLVCTIPDTQHPHRTPNKLRSRAPARFTPFVGAG